jgi:hypothetical protein
LDTPSAEWSIVDIEFLELVEEQIRKARGYLEVDEVVMEKSAFILLVVFISIATSIAQLDLSARFLTSLDVRPARPTRE